MNKKSQNRRQKSNKSFILAIFLLIVAIVVGAFVYYGFYFIQNKGNKDKVDQAKELKGDLVIETIVPTIVPSPTLEPTSTPTITKEPDLEQKPVKVKGIYVTGPRAGSGEKMKELIHLVDTTELNAMVIDIKNDSGEITYKMDNHTAKEIGADVAYIRDIEELIKALKKKDIYLIARVVAFKDPILADKKPELSLKTKDGKKFRDEAGHCWVNPYKKEVWDYLVEVAEEAVELGFDEIQFDYIRFSTDSGMKNVDFGEAGKSKTKKQIILEFTQYAYERLSKQGVFVSADVYGAVIDSQVDSKIVGQDYAGMAGSLDYICPMIYPSHYADGVYQIAHPDTQPYEIILSALGASKKALETPDNKQKVAKVRPWLQDFTASWVEPHIKYGKKEIRAQIKAVHDAGYEEWILWNGGNSYTKEGLLNK